MFSSWSSVFNFSEIEIKCVQEARAEMQREWRNGQKRCDKLRGSLESRVPKSWPSEMTAMFLNRVTDAVVTAFSEAGPPAKVV